MNIVPMCTCCVSPPMMNNLPHGRTVQAHSSLSRISAPLILIQLLLLGQYKHMVAEPSSSPPTVKRAPFKAKAADLSYGVSDRKIQSVCGSDKRLNCCEMAAIMRLFRFTPKAFRSVGS